MDDTRRDRLADVAAAWRDARETAAVHSRLLEQAVLEADRAGVSPREVAGAIGVSTTRIYAIIRNAYNHSDIHPG